MSAAQAPIAVLVLVGASLALLAAVGLHRFPDVFARMHAATKSATLGLLLILAATAVWLADPVATAKITLVAVLQLITAPVGAHMIGRAAYRAGTELSAETQIDELAQAGAIDEPAASPDSPSGGHAG